MSRSLTGGKPAREKEINEIRKSTDCTTGKMIFTKLRDKNVALLVNSGGIAAVRVLRSNASKLGGIYLGKIQNVAKNIDACSLKNRQEAFFFQDSVSVVVISTNSAEHARQRDIGTGSARDRFTERNHISGTQLRCCVSMVSRKAPIS